jgi:hypothetical protein
MMARLKGNGNIMYGGWHYWDCTCSKCSNNKEVSKQKIIDMEKLIKNNLEGVKRDKYGWYIRPERILDTKAHLFFASTGENIVSICQNAEMRERVHLEQYRAVHGYKHVRFCRVCATLLLNVVNDFIDGSKANIIK